MKIQVMNFMCFQLKWLKNLKLKPYPEMTQQKWIDFGKMMTKDYLRGLKRV